MSGTRSSRTTLVVIVGALIAVALGVLALVTSGRWSTSTFGQAVTLVAMLLSVVAIPGVLRGGGRGLAVVALAWAGVAGLILGGVGAVPPPEAADVGPQPWVDEVLALGGPRTAVALLWVVASVTGLAAIALEARRARPSQA